MYHQGVNTKLWTWLDPRPKPRWQDVSFGTYSSVSSTWRQAWWLECISCGLSLCDYPQMSRPLAAAFIRTSEAVFLASALLIGPFLNPCGRDGMMLSYYLCWAMGSTLNCLWARTQMKVVSCWGGSSCMLVITAAGLEYSLVGRQSARPACMKLWIRLPTRERQCELAHTCDPTTWVVEP